MSSVQDEFDRYEKLMGDTKIRSSLSLADKKKMYGLWCVATRGRCTQNEPSRLRLLAHGKWAAWKKYENISKEEARSRFVAEARQLMKQKAHL